MLERIEPLGPDHNRNAFSCGVKDIDDFLISFNFEIDTPQHRIYVAADELGQILGYYALRPSIWEVRNAKGKIENSSIELELAMIGVAQDLQCQKVIGRALMLDAFGKVLRAVELMGGIERFWVGPLNDRCRRFYKRIGFIQPAYTKRMMITVSEIADAVGLIDDEETL